MDEGEAAIGVPETMRDHLIVCGMGHVGYRIAELLRELCEPFVIISREIRPEWTDILKQGGVRHLIGDARSESCLREAGIEHAKGILIVTSNDLVNIQIAADAQQLNPKIGLIVRVFDHDLAERIGREMGVRDVLSPALLTAPVFVAAALGDEMLRAFTIDDCGIDVLRLTFTPNTPGLGEMLDEFCARRDLIPLAVRYEIGQEAISALNAETLRDRAKTADTAPTPGVTIRLKRPLAVGDEIVVLTSGGVTERLRRGGYLPLHAAPTSNRMPRLLTRFLRHPFAPLSALAGGWRRAPLFLRLSFSSLIGVLTLSAVVFHYAMPIPWVDAFYFVISIMTTVGFGDYNLRDSAPWLKIFGCFVMLAGAALVAIVFGIITDFIVSARVDRALGRRQSDLANHLVVIGLGDVGTRVSEALRRMKQPIVVIERNIDHEAVPSIAEDLYVIVGDASRQQVLEQANMAQARAVIVTTPDDLDNLRIAHLAERHNPNIRSVVRIYDSMLASKLVSSMGIDRAVNAAAIAAATFVACTINARTEHGFLLNGRLLLLRWMLPEESARRGMVGAAIQELQQEGLAVILSRVGTGMFQRTQPVSPEDIIGRGESLLVLEEYNPDLRACAPPTVQAYADSAAI
jgi:Trk K+ transport system NAD-binding subunit